MFTLPPDPYLALGVSRDAQLPEIRSAHRKLILKCHPDKVQDPQLKAEKQAEFQKVQQAYELLNDEIARSKYDEKVRYNEKYSELEKEKEKAKMSSSPPNAAQTPSRPRPSYYEPEIRTAEPRASTFAKSGTTPPSRKFYDAGFSSSRSFEEVPGSGSRAYDESRRSKKSASYEREREREWEREQEREKEREKNERRRRKEKEAEEFAAREQAREREREREQRDRIKQATKEADDAKKKSKDRRDKDKDKKKADKDRKRDVEDKHRRHKHYTEAPYHEDSDVDDVPVFEKKSSSSRKDDTTHIPTTERERKNSANLEMAMRYLERSGAKPKLSRSPTYQDTPGYRHVAPPVAAPTPPPATASAHPPPPPPPRDIDADEDGARRSSARSSRAKPPDALRSTPRESRDKSSHRKSGRSASRDASGPRIVEVTPSTGRIPGLTKSYSDTHRGMHLNRSYTESYARPAPHAMPGLERQNTWQQGDGGDRDRGRARRVHSFEDQSDDDGHYHRSSRRTQSPEAMVTPTRYAVASDGKTRRKYTAEAVPIPTARSHKKHATANTSSPRAEAGVNGYYPDEYDVPAHTGFSNIKYAPVVREDEVQYSTVQRGYSSSYSKDPYGVAAAY